MLFADIDFFFPVIGYFKPLPSLFPDVDSDFFVVGSGTPERIFISTAISDYVNFFQLLSVSGYEKTAFYSGLIFFGNCFL